MTHKITIDRDKCIGCGACAATCPDSFEIDEGKAVALKGEVEKLTCEKEAQIGCPVDAISVN